MAPPIPSAKVARFALTHRFDHIQIEGEHGFGKPDERKLPRAVILTYSIPDQMDPAKIL